MILVSFFFFLVQRKVKNKNLIASRVVSYNLHLLLFAFSSLIVRLMKNSFKSTFRIFLKIEIKTHSKNALEDFLSLLSNLLTRVSTGKECLQNKGDARVQILIKRFNDYKNVDFAWRTCHICIKLQTRLLNAIIRLGGSEWGIF